MSRAGTQHGRPRVWRGVSARLRCVTPAPLDRAAQGFGFTLRGPQDFKLSKFNSNAPTHSFRALYGVDNTGDVTSTANLRDYCDTVWRETDGRGLHVASARGAHAARITHARTVRARARC